MLKSTKKISAMKKMYKKHGLDMQTAKPGDLKLAHENMMKKKPMKKGKKMTVKVKMHKAHGKMKKAHKASAC